MARIDYNNGYYEGEIDSYGNECGYGTFVWHNGEKYVGYFYSKKFDGQGTYWYANGDKYVGKWCNDKRNGNGTMYFADGYSYSGNWINDKRDGFGKETYEWGYYEGLTDLSCYIR